MQERILSAKATLETDHDDPMLKGPFETNEFDWPLTFADDGQTVDARAFPPLPVTHVYEPETGQSLTVEITRSSGGDDGQFDATSGRLDVRLTLRLTLPALPILYSELDLSLSTAATVTQGGVDIAGQALDPSGHLVLVGSGRLFGSIPPIEGNRCSVKVAGRLA